MARPAPSEVPGDLDPVRLAERARRLAEVPAGPEPAGEAALIVRLGADPWALPLDGLVAVERRLLLASVPGAPPTVAGLAVRLGRVIPVFDLRVVLEIPPVHPPSRCAVVVVGGPGDPLGLAVDEVVGSTTARIRGAPRDPGRPLLVGTTADGVPILDVPWLLASDRLVVRSAPGGD